MAEAENLKAVWLALGSRPDTRVFRNNVGMGWSGKLVSRTGGRVVLTDARPVRFGLMAGSADLVGWHSFTVGPEHVGMRIARLLSPEVKTARGRASAAQRTWQALVLQHGGIAGIVRTADEALALIDTTTTEGVHS